VSDPLWLVLQLADSAFPAGGFAHSAGLEAAARLGEVTSGPELEAFLDASVWQTGRAALPFVGAAYDQPHALAELDDASDAFVLSHVANRASRAQGRAFVATCARVFGGEELVRVDEACRARALRVHLAPAWGAATRLLGLTRDAALTVFLHASLRAVLSAAVRLGLSGPHEAQRLQHARAPLLARVFDACRTATPEAAAQATPLIDLFGAAQDRLDVRLFVS
jgi:urease accessory protein